jgi:sigma-B regulation protein RsbU (phosphoserine phosphatase)
MAKFVFRSLVRDHSQPAEFLAAANDVVCGEIATGKFITLAYLVIDGASGEFCSASAGHPRPRLVDASGRVQALAVGGLALGVVRSEEYEMEPGELEPGDSLVLFTDGVVEARRDGELFGEDRLEALLAERHSASAQQLADAIVDACRQWSGGELADDCAVVVVRRDAR